MKTNRSINKSKKALKDALIILMKAKEFNKISITDLVNVADLNRGTFYKHYQSTEELLNDLIDNVIGDLIQSYREPYLQTNEFIIGELTTSSIKIFEHVDSYSDFYTNIVNSNVLPGFQNKICDVLKQLALQDLEVVVLNKNARINTDLFSSFNAYAIFGLIVEWIKSDFTYSPTYMAEQLIEILKYNSTKTIFNTSNKDY